MANALFAFENREAGESAARELLKQGLSADAVQVHFDVAKQPGHSGRDIDEQITGGLFGNLLDLFRGVMEWGSSPHDASSFEETVRRGGAVISVEAGTVDQQQAADKVAHAAACDRRTDWSSAPTH
jgi:hypothetical protein